MDADRLRHHGDLGDAELRALGRGRDGVVDFAVNVSFVGPHPAVLEAIRTADPARYPDRAMLAAREALGASAGRAADEVLVGPGAAELLWSAVRALSTPGELAVVLGPTFTEPEAAARAAGLEVLELRARPEDGFVHDVEHVDTALRASRPRLVSLSRPNNPTGTVIPFEDLSRLVEAHPACTFLVDESFLSLSTHHAEAGRALPENALRFRSLTKDHALAGVRIGLLLGPAETLRRIDAIRPPWLVSNAALAAAREASRRPEHVAGARALLLVARTRLEERLARLRIPVVASCTTYVACATGEADTLRDRLLRRHGVSVRSCASFGLPDHLRLGARPDEDLDVLERALRSELGA